ncbi:lipolytic enzyme [Methanosarcina horonobensis HB-1 = JCM 15518]|uniref:Lipolytic enzyme n=1 Tax=Methanosarcina horonobensis HB-1 = JCM 15518 TaxID=1434110 RepID=A0A0E3S9M6_9EURY|nr:lipolytic enzyme [Methanosarcina horonobensis HB-1 = JCM 15518]
MLSKSSVRICGTDIYEWLPGGFFLIHRVDVRMGDEEVKSVEVISYDHSSQTYPMHSFDNKGNYDLLQGSVHDNTLIITGKSIRFTGVFSDKGDTITGIWEMLTASSSWLPWMDLKLTRVEDLTAYPFDTGSTSKNREEKREPALTDREVTGNYAPVNGLNMYYEVHGTGRPLILLHGGVGASKMFDPVLPKLSESRQVMPSMCRRMDIQQILTGHSDLN